MWNRKELKAKGKTAFKANYWKSVLSALLLSIAVGGAAFVTANGADKDELSAQLGNLTDAQIFAVLMIVLGVVATIVLVAAIIRIFLLNPLEVGCQRFFVENSKNPAELSELGFGFKNHYGNVVATILLRDVFLFLWSLLFVIPAIVKTYSYRMVPYIVAENPDMKATDAITLSRNMMKGHKWNAFVLDLSFIGWYLLSCLTLGLLAFFYVSPYHYATNAELYGALKSK